MKKMIAMIMVLAMMFTLIGCAGSGDTVSASTNTTAAVTPTEAPKDEIVIVDETSEPEVTAAPSTAYHKPADIFAKIEDLQTNPVELMEVPADMLLDYYGIDSADVKEGLYYISLDNMLADEFVILVAIDEAAADRLQEKLENRLQRKLDEANGYSPEQAAIIENCEILRDGEYVSLIVSPDFDAISEEYKAIINTIVE